VFEENDARLLREAADGVGGTPAVTAYECIVSIACVAGSELFLAFIAFIAFHNICCRY